MKPGRELDAPLMKLDRELIEILIELAEIVHALTAEARFTGSLNAIRLLARLRVLQAACAEKENEDEAEQGT